jgi:ketosteroid isomerase-like protein
MRRLVLLSLFASSLGVSALAEERKPTDAEAREAVAAISMKFADGFNKHDPTSVSALFFDDAVIAAPFGVQTGHRAIEDFYIQLFARLGDIRNYTDIVDQAHATSTTLIWGVGHWQETSQAAGQSSEVHLAGYWGRLYEREGGAWKIRLNTYNISPSPAATPSK